MVHQVVQVGIEVEEWLEAGEEQDQERSLALLIQNPTNMLKTAHPQEALTEATIEATLEAISEATEAALEAGASLEVGAGEEVLPGVLLGRRNELRNGY